MDISFNMPAEALSPNTAIVQMYGTTATQGIDFGSTITVPPGYAAVVVQKGKTLDVLGSGTHTVDGTTFPLLTKQAKIKPFPAQNPPVSAVIMLVQGETPVMLPWTNRAILSKNKQYGLTSSLLQGRCGIQVRDPGRFCAMLIAAAGKAKKQSGFAQLPIDQQAALFLRGNIGMLTATATQKLNLPPEQAMLAQESIRSTAGQAVAQWLSNNGVQCLSFDLDAIGEPDRAPCAVCRSSQVPTGYGSFRRTISLFYVRFMAHKEGNFCVPCAVKTSLGYNGVMLVCGWWGLIGLIMTPIFFCQNLYYLANIAFGTKATPAENTVAVTADDVWPPPPSRA